MKSSQVDIHLKGKIIQKGKIDNMFCFFTKSHVVFLMDT